MTRTLYEISEHQTGGDVKTFILRSKDFHATHSPVRSREHLALAPDRATLMRVASIGVLPQRAWEPPSPQRGRALPLAESLIAAASAPRLHFSNGHYAQQPATPAPLGPCHGSDDELRLLATRRRGQVRGTSSEKPQLLRSSSRPCAFSAGQLDSKKHLASTSEASAQSGGKQIARDRSSHGRACTDTLAHSRRDETIERHEQIMAMLFAEHERTMLAAQALKPNVYTRRQVESIAGAGLAARSKARVAIERDDIGIRRRLVMKPLSTTV